jgi:Kef-type K+ transport system membrane component KefB
MRRAFALVITIALAAYAVRMAPDGGVGRPAALALGFALIAAALTGALFEKIRLPRVSGYLVFGMVCGPYLANIITQPMARDLQLVNELAIALIALIAGLELNYQHLKPRLAAMTRFGAWILLLMYLAMVPLLWLVWPWLPIAPEATGLGRIALSLLLATVIVSFSPTVTIAVIADTRARGPLSEMVLTIVVLADLALIVLFSLAMQFVRWTSGDGDAHGVGLMAGLMWEIFGSVAFGALLGALFALYLRFIGREVTIMLLALCLLLSELGPLLHFEALIAALTAGLVIENIAQPSGDALKEAVERGALPVLVVFFAAAGASLQLDTLASIGAIATVFALVRVALIRGSASFATRLSGVPPEPGNRVWMGLVSQAGVTLGLAVLIAREFPEWGIAVQSLVVALNAIHAVAGPILFRAALAQAGEIGRMDAASP